MFAIRRKSEPDKVALPGRLLIAAEAVVGKIAQLIVAEVENCNRLAHTALFGAVSLVEQGGVTPIATQRDGCRIAVGARDEARTWNGQGLVRREVDFVRALRSTCDTDHQTENGNRRTGDNCFHRWKLQDVSISQMGFHLWLSIGFFDLVNHDCLDARSLKHPACNLNSSSHEGHQSVSLRDVWNCIGNWGIDCPFFRDDYQLRPGPFAHLCAVVDWLQSALKFHKAGQGGNVTLKRLPAHPGLVSRLTSDPVAPFGRAIAAETGSAPALRQCGTFAQSPRCHTKGVMSLE